MATKVNLGTKQADRMIHEFNRIHHKGVSLFDVYDRSSRDKISSWEKIRDKCRELDGWNLHITGCSSWSYSCIYAYKNEDGNTVLRKETAENTFELTLKDAS